MSVAQAFTVRSARSGDLEAVRGLLRAVALPVEGVAEGFAEGYAVAEQDGRITASAGIEVHGHAGLLRSVAVDPTLRSVGLGKRLVRDRLAWAESRGLDGIYLLTTTACDYFRRFGFQAIDRGLVPNEIRESIEFRLACPRSAVVMHLSLDGDGRWTREAVREKYAAAALGAQHGREACCGAASQPGSGGKCGNPITANLYEAAQTDTIPRAAKLASLGCGNPTVLAELRSGEIVLDLGSGGGIDVLLSAKRVGPKGKAYGLDMTDEMLELARENQREAGVENIEFLKGEIEHIPLPDDSVDVIISNCVINLSADKDRVLREAFRVLKPGGRFAVSDVVTRGAIPAEIRQSILLWVGCVAGALEESEYREKLGAAGFEQIEVEPTRVYRAEDARDFLPEEMNVEAIAPYVDGKIMSAFVRGVKPASAIRECCGPA